MSYLSLLHLPGDIGARAVRQAFDLSMTEPAALDDALGYLSDVNWRATLVASVAALFLPRDARLVAALWHRFDAGSWIGPQLAVILSMVDSDFESASRIRLESCSGVSDAMIGGLTPKSAHALLWVASSRLSVQTWRTTLSASPTFQSLLERDTDAGHMIAQKWQERLLAILSDLNPQNSP